MATLLEDIAFLGRCDDWVPERAMQFFDRDGDGLLNHEEFCSLVDTSPELRRLSRKKKEKLYNAVDIDASGGVNIIELTNWLQLGAPNGKAYIKRIKQQKQIQEAFNLFDLDGNGELSKEEFRIAMCSRGTKPMSEEDFEKLYAVYDHDGDGSINYEEFAKTRSETKAMERMERSEHMIAVPIFEDCEERFVEMLSRYLRKSSFEDGDFLAHANERGDQMWLIREGKVELRDAFGKVVHAFAAGENDGVWQSPAIGERALVEDMPRRYDIVAVGNIVVNSLSAEHFEKCLSRYPKNRSIVAKAVDLKYSSTGEVAKSSPEDIQSKSKLAAQRARRAQAAGLTGQDSSKLATIHSRNSSRQANSHSGRSSSLGADSRPSTRGSARSSSRLSSYLKGRNSVA